MINQYEPFLPPSFDPEDPDYIQICVDRLNPVTRSLDEYIDELERKHTQLHLAGLHQGEIHALICAEWARANVDRDKASMAVWS